MYIDPVKLEELRNYQIPYNELSEEEKEVRFHKLIEDLKSDDQLPKHDLVNHPPHYKGKRNLESIDVIEAFDLGFNLGNAVKYILRCNKKGNKIQDLDKAIWYLKREIENS